MTTGEVLDVTALRIAFFAKCSENRFNDTLVRIASGKRINRPADGIPDYFFGDKMMRMSRSYSDILRNISEGMAFLDVVVNTGERVFNGIAEMKELARRYYNSETDEDEKVALKAEFQALKGTVASIIELSKYDGVKLVSDNNGVPFKSISLDDETTQQRIDIEFNEKDIPDVTLLTLGESEKTSEMSALELQLCKAGAYLGKGAALMRGLNAHYNLATSQIATTRTSAQRSVESDAAEDMLNLINNRIRTEASMAMLAQANMYRASVVKLMG